MSSKWLIQPGTGNRFDAALAAGIAESLTLSEAVKLTNHAGELMVVNDVVISELPLISLITSTSPGKGVGTLTAIRMRDIQTSS